MKTQEDFEKSNKILCRLKSSKTSLCFDWYKISTATYQLTQINFPIDLIFHQHCRKNLKSHNILRDNVYEMECYVTVILCTTVNDLSQFTALFLGKLM
jgi:hypothetical protein